MEFSEEIIYANSQIRPLLINKEEYYLCYSHNDLNIQEILNSILENLTDDDKISKENPTIGKIDIFCKKPEDKKYYKFTSNGEIGIKDTFNMNVMNNDNFILNKIINTLSGVASNNKNSVYLNEIFKIEKSANQKFYFKISIQTKSGVILTIFNCEVEKIYFQDDFEYLAELSKFYKEKIKISNLFTKKIDEKVKKNEEAIIKFHTINKKIEEQEKFLLENICSLLNMKKSTLREFSKNDDICVEIDRDGIEKYGSNREKLNTLISKNLENNDEDNPNASMTLSLSDL